MLKVDIYQKSSHPIDELSHHELIGSVEFTLASFLKSSTRSLTVPFNATSGSILVRGGNVHETRDMLTLQFSAHNLPKVSGFFSTCDPFITISRILEDGNPQRVWRNLPLKFTSHPTWPVIDIPLQVLCNGDLDLPLHIELLDWNSNGEHVPIGYWDIPIRSLISKSEWEVSLTNSANTDCGVLHVSNISLDRHPTFLQYVRGGCKLTVAIGIDFTQNNGEPSDPKSYHYWDATHHTLNQYEKAISSVGSILEEYDDDKMFPVYGFGAKVRDSVTREFSPTQHWFPLSNSNEEVRGVGGILELYRQSMRNIQFDQPILMKPLIDHVVRRCQGTCTQDNQKYTVLLLLTCGGIADFEQTIDSIVHAAAIAPLSIIIAGVGDSNFEGYSIYSC